MSQDSPSTQDLESAQNHTFQRRELIAERLAWILVGAILIAGLLGLLGPGPLGAREAVSDDGRLKIEHYAMERYEAPAELLIHVRPEQADGQVRLAVSRAFTDSVTPEMLSPDPIAVEMQPDRLIYLFNARNISDGGHIVFRFKFNTFGKMEYKVKLDPNSEVSISQFILP